MNYGFWEKLQRPIMALAPMYDVTDAPFRKIIAKYGKPDVMWTEFVSAEGLMNDVGRPRLEHHLMHDASEAPLVAQIFGSHSEAFAPTAEYLEAKGFAGIDINMGCPDKSIVKQGSCAGLFKTPKLAQEIIRETMRGTSLPVSVKIRIGDVKPDWKDWILYLLETKPAAISIHLRTRKEMSKVPAHWELMPEIVQFIHANAAEGEHPVILGNGDVPNPEDGKLKVAESGCDGVMIGRGIFGNPWLFSGSGRPDLRQRMNVLLEHAKLYEQTFAGKKSYELMKKHFKAYVNGFDGAASLRADLMAVKDYAQTEAVIVNYLKNEKGS